MTEATERTRWRGSRAAACGARHGGRLRSRRSPARAELPRWFAGCWSGSRDGEQFTERWIVADDSDDDRHVATR